MSYLLLLAGLSLLVLGGDLLVRGAVSTALRFRVSPMTIGLTLVGFGTSMPELVTSLEAALLEVPGIAIGNVVGSNTANILLILGLSALIMPLAVNTAVLRRDGTAMAGAALVCLAAVLAGHVGREAGAVLCSLLLLYLVLVHRQQRRGPAAESSPETLIPGPRLNGIGTALGTFVAGLGLTVIGADLLVGAAIELARAWSVSDTVIGVTIVAIGTSLPELVTSVTAAVRNQADIAFGNIVGSNIFNVLGILGVTALVHPLTVPAEIANLDIWFMLGATVLLLACAARGRLTRRHGTAFLLIYAGYLGIVLI